ncbi:FecCD family ABC transporter permease [Clostridium tyrobutyricum]|uniref:FecCD family ABC transporter permease n=1 Tax=Clostridium tyrobutyricum TaxID=1519 RepID=UPI00214FAB3B|nr:iron ABC transporter permease [Clostridium tyrobutyricum]
MCLAAAMSVRNVPLKFIEKILSMSSGVVSIADFTIIIICTLLTASIVSVSGVIGFVGLIIPHISRTFVGSKHSRLMPVSILLGGIFLIWADVCARVVVSPEELPIGVVTAFIGAPFFLWLLKKSSYSFGGGR